jgi:hypothetical protein
MTFGVGLEKFDEMQPTILLYLDFESEAGNTVEPDVTFSFFTISVGSPSYSLEGPPTTAPVKLGVRKGDKLILVGAPGGTRSEYTIVDPTVISVLETIDVPAGPYRFIIRRVATAVLTDSGREHLAKLISWQTFGNPDVAHETQRVRWAEAGDGILPQIRGVSELLNPISVDGTNYLALLSVPSFLAVTWARFEKLYGSLELSHSAPVIVSEFGLFVDEDSGGGPNLDPTAAGHVPFAYTALEEGMVKFDGFALRAKWDFRF